MISERLPVVISIASAPDWLWKDIAAGWWEPVSGHLDIEGETTIPVQVISELTRPSPVEIEGGHAETRYGDFRYRMTFGRSPKQGH